MKKKLKVEKKGRKTEKGGENYSAHWQEVGERETMKKKLKVEKRGEKQKKGEKIIQHTGRK